MSSASRTTSPGGQAHGRHAPAAASRALLIAGAAAGPLYALVAAAQMLVRDGFDPRHHAVSLLANGDWGWVQSANFLFAGLLTVAGAVGIGSVLRPGPGKRWGPLLLGLYGVGLLAAGVFPADPAQGFPPGTPDDPVATATWVGAAHLAAGGIGFGGLIAACLVFARRFVAGARSGWALFSAGTGLVLPAAFAGIASGTASAAANLAFTLAVALAWAWFTALTLSLVRSISLRRAPS